MKPSEERTEPEVLNRVPPLITKFQNLEGRSLVRTVMVPLSCPNCELDRPLALQIKVWGYGNFESGCITDTNNSMNQCRAT